MIKGMFHFNLAAIEAVGKTFHAIGQGLADATSWVKGTVSGLSRFKEQKRLRAATEEEERHRLQVSQLNPYTHVTHEPGSTEVSQLNLTSSWDT